MSLDVIDQISLALQQFATVNTKTLPRGILVDVPLVLAQSIGALEELATLIAINSVGMRVVRPHHVSLQRSVRVEITPTDLADEFLDLCPLHDLAEQRTLLLLEVVGVEVDWPATGIFPNHFLTEGTLDLFQFGVCVSQVFLQGLFRGNHLRAVLTGVRDLHLFLLSFPRFMRRIFFGCLFPFLHNFWFGFHFVFITGIGIIIIGFFILIRFHLIVVVVILHNLLERIQQSKLFLLVIIFSWINIGVLLFFFDLDSSFLFINFGS